MAPAQKPGCSEQSVGTPPEFLAAVCRRLGVLSFSVDLAAAHDNAVCDAYFTRETNSLVQAWHQFCGGAKGWAWLNPPYADIAIFADKAVMEAQQGAQIAMLVPAATDTKWWSESCVPHAYITYLQQRITFVGHAQGYPKGLALILFAPFLRGGSTYWKWRVKP